MTKEQLERQWRNVKKLKLFITLEGGEGTGKTTTALALQEKLKEHDYDSYLTREPGGKGLDIAEDIRNIIMKHGNIDPITELFLFNASRREHVDKIIKPNLDEGKIVISDRFSDSTVVYQGLVKKTDKETINTVNSIAIQETEPQMVFIFDLDPIEGKKRIDINSRETNRFDDNNIEFHNNVRQGYLDLQKTNEEKYILVDASKPPKEIADFIFEKIIDYENKLN